MGYERVFHDTQLAENYSSQAVQYTQEVYSLP